MRGEREVVSHGGVDFPSAGATKTFVRVYLDERSWLVGSSSVFVFLSSRRQQCGMGGKNRRSKGRQRNLRSKMESWTFSFLKKKPFFPFSFPYVSPPPFFFWAGLIKRRKSIGFLSNKKHLTKRKVHVQNNSTIPPRSRAPRAVLLKYISSRVSMCRHNSITRSQNVDQSERREYKQEPLFLLPTPARRKKNKKGYIQALELFHSPLLSFFCPLLDSLPPKPIIPLPPPFLQKRIKQLTKFPSVHFQKW